MKSNAPVNENKISQLKEEENSREQSEKKQVPQSSRQIAKATLHDKDEDNRDNQLIKHKSNDHFSISLKLKNLIDIKLTLNDKEIKINHKPSKSFSDNKQEPPENNCSLKENKQIKPMKGQLKLKHFQPQSEASFLNRMSVDLHKRRTKEERINQLMEKNKVKHTEKERILGFNRLIDDANRRIEAKSKIEGLKTQITEEGQITADFKKSYNDNKWNEIYKERFEKYQLQSKEKILTKQKELTKKQQEDEESVVRLIRETSKKIPKEKIDQIYLRLYEDQRKVFAKEPEEEQQQQQQLNNNHTEVNPSKDQRSMTPNKPITKHLTKNKSGSNCLKKSLQSQEEKDMEGTSCTKYNQKNTSNGPTYKNILFRTRTEYDNYTSSKVKNSKQSMKKSVPIVNSPKNSNHNDIELIEKNLITSLAQSNIAQSQNKSFNQLHTTEIKQRTMKKAVNDYRQSKSPFQCKLIMRDIDADKLVQNVFKKTQMLN